MDNPQDLHNLMVERIQQAMQNQNPLVHFPITSHQMSHLIKSQSDPQNLMKRNDINLFQNEEFRNNLQFIQNINRNISEGFNLNEIPTQDFVMHPSFNERLLSSVANNSMDHMMFPMPIQIKSEMEDDQQYYDVNQDYVNGLPAHMSIDNEVNPQTMQPDPMYVYYNNQMTQQTLSTIDLYARQQNLAQNYSINNDHKQTHPQNLVINRNIDNVEDKKLKKPKENLKPDPLDFNDSLEQIFSNNKEKNENDSNTNNKNTDDIVYKSLIVAECANIKGEFSCYKCNECFSTKRSLRQHSKSCLKEGEETETPLEKINGKFNCSLCAYKCQSPAILNIHERTHTGEKPFSCKFCEYKSSQKNNVAKHMLVHMKQKPFHCQYCDYKCAQKNNLIVHERTHTGDKPFACTFCEYKTVQKPNLVKHMYLHTDEKPFSCDLCNYKCVQKTNLTKHKQRHLNEKGPLTAKSRPRKISKEISTELKGENLVLTNDGDHVKLIEASLL